MFTGTVVSVYCYPQPPSFRLLWRQQEEIVSGSRYRQHVEQASDAGDKKRRGLRHPESHRVADTTSTLTHSVCSACLFLCCFCRATRSRGAQHVSVQRLDIDRGNGWNGRSRSMVRLSVVHRRGDNKTCDANLGAQRKISGRGGCERNERWGRNAKNGRGRRPNTSHGTATFRQLRKRLGGPRTVTTLHW